MRRRRTVWILGAVLLVAVVVAAAFILRGRAAPEPARLLPEADAYAYLNLRPLRMAGVIGNRPLASAEPEYEEFVRQTGFQFERDLDEAAVAIHAAPRLVDVEPGTRQPESFRRFSWIFRGRFDSQRAERYFRQLARSVESYREVEIYSIPLEGRTVRIALLGVGLAAVSNTDGPQAIHYMVDRYKQTALPFGGPPLVREYYSQVPLGSLIWAIAQTNAEAGRRTPLTLPGGYDLFFPASTVVVGSIRYAAEVQVKAQAFTATPDQAKQIVDEANAFLNIFHGLENSMNPSGADPDVKAFFQSLHVEQNKNRAVLSAAMSPAFLKKLFAEAPAQVTGPPPAPAPEKPEKPTRRGKQGRR
jgi:hypothetical protein